MQKVPNWLATLILIALTPFPIRSALKMAVAEAHRQTADYRPRTNRCMHCGYSLTGLRRISNICPECGELFKKIE